MTHIPIVRDAEISDVSMGYLLLHIAMTPSVPSPPFLSPGAGWSASRRLNDCMLLCSAPWNAGQT